MYTKGNFTHQVNGDYNLLVKGTHTTQVGDDTTLDCHSDYYHYVGNAIDPAKAGKGRGNKGGSSTVAIANDYKLNVDGVTTEIYGNKDAYDNSNTTTKRNTILFGEMSERIIGGGKFEQIDNNSDEVIGKNHNITVLGGKFEEISMNLIETIGIDHTINVVGDKKQTVEGQYSSQSTLDTNINATAKVNIVAGPEVNVTATDVNIAGVTEIDGVLTTTSTITAPNGEIKSGSVTLTGHTHGTSHPDHGSGTSTTGSG
jgi:phage baseplate assembly protein gpV